MKTVYLPAMHPSWKALLQPEFDKPYFQELVAFVFEERKRGAVYPPSGSVFNALKETPYEQANVLILGQDPYHGPRQAHGLSFSVPAGVPVPPSLANIYKELSTDVGFIHPGHGCLLGWAKQGVLLLNAILTVRAQEAGSHRGKGWETFTDAVIQALNVRETSVVFVLWGAYAREKRDLIDRSRHTIITSAHPSPMSAERGFFGSRPFSQVNTALERSGLPRINWQLPAL